MLARLRQEYKLENSLIECRAHHKLCSLIEPLVKSIFKAHPGTPIPFIASFMIKEPGATWWFFWALFFFHFKEGVAIFLPAIWYYLQSIFYSIHKWCRDGGPRWVLSTTYMVRAHPIFYLVPICKMPQITWNLVWALSRYWAHTQYYPTHYPPIKMLFKYLFRFN